MANRRDEMYFNRFVDESPAPAKQPQNRYIKGPATGGGLSRARLAQMQADEAVDTANLAKGETNAQLARSMGEQAKRRKAEALSTGREARAKALRRY